MILRPRPRNALGAWIAHRYLEHQAQKEADKSSPARPTQETRKKGQDPGEEAQKKSTEDLASREDTKWTDLPNWYSSGITRLSRLAE